jgi:Leucine-rich repeat (LRR) protein
MKKLLLALMLASALFADQKQALSDFFNATNGKNWADKTNWLKGDVCTWNGVECDKDKDVIALNLFGNNLEGEIPSSIEELKKLAYLNLGFNKIKGNSLDAISQLKKLSVLNLANNKLSLEIPKSIGNLSALTSLDLSENSLRGAIPSTIGKLSNLESLKLNQNNLALSIPKEIANLKKLKYFDVVHNALTGKLPKTSFENIEYFNVGYNALSGEIPDSIYTPKLNNLHFSNNNFEGKISSAVKNLKEIKFLTYANNHLSGALPSELMGLTTLTNAHTDRVMRGYVVGIDVDNNCKLHTDDEKMIAFMETKSNADWKHKQTHCK